jgi:phage tail sheath protein FI
MNYQAPGVYIKYVTEGPLAIPAESTSTALFVGPTKVGGSVNSTNDGVTPLKIRSVKDYADAFATKGASLGAVSMPTVNSSGTDHMGLAVSGFFLNGGSTAYVVSTKQDAGAVAATGVFAATNGGTTLNYRVTAASAGAWGNDVSVSLSASASGAGFIDIIVSLALQSDGGTNTVQTERFLGIGIDKVEGLSSSIVSFAETTDAGTVTLDTAAPGSAETLALTTGADSTASTMGYADIFAALADVDDISLIVLPDKSWSGTDQGDISQALAHAQASKDRLVLVQAADDTTDFGTVGPETEYISAYYPMGKVAMKNAAGDVVTSTTSVTGYVAGVIARTDQTKGPWTAAAGTHADLRGVTGLTHDVGQNAQADINSEGVNAIRFINGLPTIWGAKTRDRFGIYRYQPVMRTAFLIADSLRTALEPAVFAKNTEVLWGNLKASVTGFMTGLYAQGAFQGATASQAFEVACGLGETMTQAEIDTGLLRLTVRFRAAKPAEFIEVSVEQLFADSL